MTNDCVFDLSELTLSLTTKTLVKGEKLMTDRYKKIPKKLRLVQRQISVTKNSYIFLHNNDCETPYVDIYTDLLLINFNLLSLLLPCGYHQISDFEIYTALTTT